MANIIRPLRRNLLLPHSKTLPFLHKQQNPISFIHKLNSPNSSFFSPYQKMVTRNYITEMRNSAFKDKILRLIRKEIQYEIDRAPPKQPITKFGSFTVDDRPGEQWISLTRKFGENEAIKVEATMFDGSVPIPKTGGSGVPKDVKPHITVIVNITKGDDDDDDVLEIVCSAWPDALDITKLFIRRDNKKLAQPYVGPEFKELDDELQDSLYEFLEVRGIDDKMAGFLHEYMRNKDKTECVRWMDTVKCYIEE